jgi:hypothetical protein
MKCHMSGIRAKHIVKRSGAKRKVKLCFAVSEAEHSDRYYRLAILQPFKSLEKVV